MKGYLLVSSVFLQVSFAKGTQAYLSLLTDVSKDAVKRPAQNGPRQGKKTSTMVQRLTHSIMNLRILIL